MYSKSPSFWEKEHFLKNVDILIIGSGLVGLLSSIRLKAKFPQSNIVILERAFIPSGASTKNAGFACFGSLTELIEDSKQTSMNDVLSLAYNRYRGLQLLLDLAGSDAIEYESFGGYEIFTNENLSEFEECKEQMNYFNVELGKKLGLGEIYSIVDDKIESLGLSKVDHLIYNRAEGQINTGLLMKKLLSIAFNKGIQIFNGIGGRELIQNSSTAAVVLDNGWTIDAKKIILANNAFAKEVLPELEVEAVRNPVLITKPIDDLRLKGSFHFEKGFVYFRNVGNRILIGGGRQWDIKTEQSRKFGINPNLESKLMGILKENVLRKKSFEIETKWSGILGIGKNKKPIVKKISNNIFVAVKMGGMGVAISSLVAEEVEELVDGR